MTVAIDIQGVSKHFRLYQEKYSSLKERVLHVGKIPYDDFLALDGIEAQILEGETVGILGRNGSGKSTLLKCIAGILQPTSGQIVVRGQVAAMLELGAGMQPELSGRDNIFLSGSLLGLSRREIERRFDQIVEFAELEQFIDNQVKYYSSGMYVRLGFAVAVNVDPDVLLVDEVLAVGDERFQQKCLDRVKLFQNEGRTIIFVSHSPDLMRSLCQRVLVLEHGALMTTAPPGEAIRTFRQILLETDPTAIGPEAIAEAAEVVAGEHARSAEQGDDGASSSTEATASDTIEVGAPSNRRLARIIGVTGHYEHEKERGFIVSGESVTVLVDYEAIAPVADVVFVVSLRADDGGLMYTSDSGAFGGTLNLPVGPGRLGLTLEGIPLLDGAYALSVALQEAGGGTLHDLLDPAYSFQIVNPGRTGGVVTIPLRVEFDAPAAAARDGLAPVISTEARAIEIGEPVSSLGR
jgi:ABC-2 type transport system ATP-binding protein